jgi:hypothetical protein
MWGAGVGACCASFLRWTRVALLAVSLAALAQELVVITDAQIAKLAQSFGPVAKSRLMEWRNILTAPK